MWANLLHKRVIALEDSSLCFAIWTDGGMEGATNRGVRDKPSPLAETCGGKKNRQKHCLILLFSPLGRILKSHHLLFLAPSINVAAERAEREPGSFVHAVPVTPSVSELQARLISACTPFLLCD